MNGKFDTADALDRFRMVKRGAAYTTLFPSDAEEAIAALEEKISRDNPRPLTLDELRERDGKPVYIVDGEKGNNIDGWYIACIPPGDEPAGSMEFYNGALYEPDEDFYAMYHNDPQGQYGLHVLGWLAFDHKPKEG